MMTKPNLSTPPEPTSQIGLLKTQPCASKGNQTRLPHTTEENLELISMCARKPTRPSLIVPQTVRAQLKIPQLKIAGPSNLS